MYALQEKQANAERLQEEYRNRPRRKNKENICTGRANWNTSALKRAKKDHTRIMKGEKRRERKEVKDRLKDFALLVNCKSEEEEIEKLNGLIDLFDMGYEYLKTNVEIKAEAGKIYQERFGESFGATVAREVIAAL